jgi:polysaccharide export outer membrane protein
MQKLFLLITATLLFSTTIFSQSVSDKVLKEKAKQYGVSDDVARKKAVDMGYDVTSSGGESTAKETAVAPIEQKVNTITKPIANYSAPGFGSNAFGYDIFNYKPKTFEPGLNVPVPKNYVLGPGDEIIVSLWGETQLVNNYVVSKEGTIYMPASGMININGLTLDELRNKLFQVLAKTYSTLANEIADNKTYMEITTGALRTVKIFCLGEIVQPGGYSLPSLSTVFTSLYFSGGPKINGSLRNIKVIREGKEIVKMDLYKYLLSGTKSDDISLQEGDVIYIPRVGKRVEINGNIFRPAVYELFSTEKLYNISLPSFFDFP